MEGTNTRHVILVGDAGTGKTSLIFRQTKGKFLSEPPTVAIDCSLDKHSTSLLGFRNDTYNMRIWDTAGTEKYDTLSKSFFKKADSIILCFDISNEESFLNLAHWRKQIEANAPEDVPIVLVGTKSDLEAQRQIPSEKLIAYAEANQLYYVECSSLTGSGVKEAFFLAYDMAILYKFQATKEMICNLEDMQANHNISSQIVMTDCLDNDQFINKNQLLSIAADGLITRSNSQKMKRIFTPKNMHVRN